ncbi:zinc finger protein 62 homolog [Gigantopelta aegis]|uniref:zinc finger protein 62 homolog n=1 Tax=Gigantopelta aegis TaxID=1735272 RepID=UPI001B8894C8|nr:zinc finger protein 62 homolog [Gigantopelta aegis]
MATSEIAAERVKLARKKISPEEIKRRQKCRSQLRRLKQVFIGDEIERWNIVKEDNLLKNNKEVARLLLNIYEAYQAFSHPNTSSNTQYQNCEFPSTSVAEVKDEPVININNDDNNDSYPSVEPLSHNAVMCVQSEDYDKESDIHSDVTDLSSDSFDSYESLDELYVTFKDVSSSEDTASKKKKKRKPINTENDCPSEYVQDIGNNDLSSVQEKKQKKKHKKYDCDKIWIPSGYEVDVDDDYVTDNIGIRSFSSVNRAANRNVGIKISKPTTKKASNNQYVCTSCPEICSSVAEADEHILSHYIACEECGKQYCSVSLLRSHLRKCHVPISFTCLVSGCEYTTETKTSIFKHIQIGHSKEVSLECALCSATSRSAYLFTKHIKFDHYMHIAPESLGTSTLCDVCGTCYPGPEELKDHIQSIHGARKRLGICDICGEVFANKKLRAHKRSKHTEKTMPCTFEGCHVMFSSQYLRKTHFKEVHLGIKAHRCPYEGCSYGDHSKSRLATHIDMVHLKVRKVPCTWPGCDKTFFDKSHLRVHMRIHFDERPLACELCDYTCRQRTALNWHLKKKHNSEDVGMDFCENSVCGGSERVRTDVMESSDLPVGIPAVSHAKKPGRKGKKAKNQTFD